MKTDQPEFAYKTHHVDIILWNYCYGMFDMLPWMGPDDRIKAFDQNVKSKIAQIKAIYDVTPSFTVVLKINPSGDGSTMEMKKIPVAS